MLDSTKMLLSLCDREIMWLRKHYSQYKTRKFIIFGAGAYGVRCFDFLTKEVGLEIEFFIDNNSELAGTTVCGKPIMLPSGGVKDYFVFVATGVEKRYKEMSNQLDQMGVPYMLSSAFNVITFWSRIKNVLNALNDDNSKLTYMAVVWQYLTTENTYILQMRIKS